VSRPICKTCKTHPCDNKGSGFWHKECSSCRKKPWVRFKADNCEVCGFVPVNRVQLDVDHIDGNKKNNSLDNLQTLCANCHRLKTYLNGDNRNK